MKTIGLIGGMSWESTGEYYRIVNERISAALGGYHSAKILLYSVDFAEVEAEQRKEDWTRVGALMADAAMRLVRGGADFVLLGTNTMHRCAAQIEAAIPVPFVHIADATADTLLARGLTRVALLGTRYTMEQDFYKARLTARGIAVDIPDEAERAMIHSVIFDELCFGKQLPQSKAAYLRVVERLAAAGAQAAVLGCTEIGMLISQADTAVPLVDTTVVHAEKAAEMAMA